MLGGMGGELETDLPFKLVHPRPDSVESEQLANEKTKARAKVGSQICAQIICDLRGNQRGKSSATRTPSSMNPSDPVW